jgi:HAD superfamily hydrolase (TIGR01549 family)
MVKAAIFDVDGTLVDSVDQHARAWQDAFRDFGHEIRFEDIRSQIGKGGDQLMPVFLSEEELDRRGKPLEQHRSQILKDRYLPTIRAFPCVRELFARLRQDGVKIVLASSSKTDELEMYKKIADIGDLVDAQTTSDDVDRSKPHPDVFASALGRIPGIGPADALVIGDTPYDAEAAGKAGLRTIGLLCGGFAEADLRRAGCIAIYRDPEHLLHEYAASPFAAPSVAASSRQTGD